MPKTKSTSVRRHRKSTSSKSEKSSKPRKSSSSKQSSSRSKPSSRRHSRRHYSSESGSESDSESELSTDSEDDRRRKHRSERKARVHKQDVAIEGTQQTGAQEVEGVQSANASGVAPAPQAISPAIAAAAGVAPVASVRDAVELSKELSEQAANAPPVASEKSDNPAEITEAVKEANEDDTIHSEEIKQFSGESESHGNKHSGSGVDYAAAYSELFTCLSTRMVDKLYRFFQKLYVQCGNESKFKKQLANIPSWNQKLIGAKTQELITAHPSIVSYFKFAYAANVMLMSVVVQRDENSEDVAVDVPKFTEFVHRSYSESARKIFDYAGVFDPTLPPRERLMIRNELYRCFGEALSTSLRLMVPLSKIAPNAVDDEEGTQEFEEGDFEELMRGEISDDEEEEEEPEEVQEKSKKKKSRHEIEEEDENSDSGSEDGSGDSEDDDSDSGSDDSNSGSGESGSEDLDEEDSEEESSSEEEAPPPRKHKSHKSGRSSQPPPQAANNNSLAFF